MSTKTAPNTPYQKWFATKPDVSNLRIFGSTASRKKRISKDVVFNEQVYDTPREGSVQADDQAAKQLLFDLMIHSAKTVTPDNAPGAPSYPILNENNVLYLIIHLESSQHAYLPTTDAKHPNPLTPVQEIHYPHPTHHIPVIPTTSQDEMNVEPPSDRTRHSKYPLRFREPKRQWVGTFES